MKLASKSSILLSTAKRGCEICDAIAGLDLPPEAHDTFTCAKQKRGRHGCRVLKFTDRSIVEDRCEICDVIAELNLPPAAHDTFTCAKQKQSEERHVPSFGAGQARLSKMTRRRVRAGVVCAPSEAPLLARRAMRNCADSSASIQRTWN